MPGGCDKVNQGGQVYWGLERKRIFISKSDRLLTLHANERLEPSHRPSQAGAFGSFYNSAHVVLLA